MKVALLSFHNAYNYGAALQAYALQEAISEFGIQSEYIDYVNTHRLESYDMRCLLRRAIKDGNIKKAVRVLLGMPFIALRKKHFDRFFSKYLRVTEKRYTSSVEMMELNEVYDRFVVGSDQVWNPDHNGNDTAYLLDFVKDPRKCISYSPSFGTDSLPADLEERYGRYLSRFVCLGVREMKGAELVEKLTGMVPELLLDPVFLLSKEKWESLLGDTQEKNYVFFYTSDKHEIKDFTSTGYPLEGKKKHILCTKISPVDFLNPKNKMVVSIPVSNFLSEIYYADLVVTSSFHCLAFSILFQKPFLCVLSGDLGKDERLVNLLAIFHLEDRILRVDTSVDKIKEQIDYRKLTPLLDDYIGRSRNFLKSALLSGKLAKTHLSDILASDVCCQDERCTGCGVCGEVCLQQAITMQYSSEGFLMPAIDSSKCVHCGLCRKHCQVFAPRPEQSKKQTFWCVKNNDEVRSLASSGGVFFSLAEKILLNNGVVAAAELDEHYQVRHVLIDDIKQLDRVRGTFYVQSDCSGIYRKVKKVLEQQRRVLFVGTPCQVNGLKCFLGKEYETLLLCDLVCHGVPGQPIFDKFLEFLRTKGELQSYRFRDKKNGWRGYTESAVIGGKECSRVPWLTSYTAMFSKNRICRQSCAQCRYANLDRCGDLTIGDFWTVKKLNKKWDDDRGTSLVICNTAKGKDFFSGISFPLKAQVEREDVMQRSLSAPSRMSKDRFRTLRTIRVHGYSQAAKIYGYDNFKGFVKLHAQIILQRCGFV